MGRDGKVAGEKKVVDRPDKARGNVWTNAVRIDNLFTHNYHKLNVSRSRKISFTFLEDLVNC